MKIKILAVLLYSLLSWPVHNCLARGQTANPDTGQTTSESTSPDVPTQEGTTKAEGTQSLEEALDNKPGINFSSVQIGGQSSGISLSSIQADAVESLEALKLATPDMDADIIGGTLNLKFKPAFTQRRATRQIRIYVSQYTLADKPGPSIYLTEGQAFGEDHRWGYLLNARATKSVIAQENLNRAWLTKPKSNWPGIWQMRDFQIEKESAVTKGASANLLLDFELSQKLRLTLRGIFTDTYRTEVNRNLEYDWNEGDFISLEESSAIIEDLSIYKGIEDRKYERRDRDITMGLDYRGDDWRWEIQFKSDESDTQYPLRLDSFFKLTGVDASYDDAQSTYPSVRLLNGTESRANDTGLFLFDEVRKITSADITSDKIASFDLERGFETSSGLLRIKSGIKFLQRNLDSSDDVRVFDEITQPITIAQFESDWKSGPIHGQKYSLEGFHDHIKFREYFDNNQDQFVLNETRTRSQTDPAIFTVDETISSIFLMGDYVWDQWRLIAGVRTEKTEDEFTGKEVTFNPDGSYEKTIDTAGGRTYSNLFPGIQAVYQATDNLTLYSSLSQALERPRYYYLAPFRRIIQRTQDIRAGNPDLKATEFTSFLAAADWSYADSGFLSVEMLRRNNENIVVESQSIIKEGQFKDYELFTWENAAQGTLNQVELVWNQDLDPLLYDLSGFSVEMRYRVSDTKTNVRGPDSLPLPIAGIPDDDVRASLVYQNQNWLLRLRADYMSDRLRRVGANPEADTYDFAITGYDFSVEYRASSGWVGNVGIYNFNGDDRQSYYGVSDRPTSLISRGPYWRSSLRYTF